MVEYNTINVKVLDSQLNKLKKVKNYLPHELFLTTRQITKLRISIENNMSTDIKLSKAQISKIFHSGGFLGSLLSKIAGLLMKVAAPLAQNVLAPLGIDARIQKTYMVLEQQL